MCRACGGTLVGFGLTLSQMRHRESLSRNAANGIGGYRETRHARACPGHPRLNGTSARKTWMAGTSPAMTEKANHFQVVREGLKCWLHFRSYSEGDRGRGFLYFAHRAAVLVLSRQCPILIRLTQPPPPFPLSSPALFV